MPLHKILVRIFNLLHVGLQVFRYLRLLLFEACTQCSAFRKKHHHAQPLQVPVAIHRQVIDTIDFVARLPLKPLEHLVLGALRERLCSGCHRFGEPGDEGRVVTILDNLFQGMRYVC